MNLGEVENNRVQSAGKWSYLSDVRSPAYVTNAHNETLQVRLNCLACCDDLRFFTAGRHIPHDDHHKRFDPFLQFPNLLVNSTGVLVKPYSFRLLHTHRLYNPNTYLAHLKNLDSSTERLLQQWHGYQRGCRL